MDEISYIKEAIVCMVHAQEVHACMFDVSEILDDTELEEMHTALLGDFNIKSAKIFENVYLYYLGILSEDAEKALITHAKLEYYFDNCQ